MGVEVGTVRLSNHSGWRVVFEIAPTGEFTLLHSFVGFDGAAASAALVADFGGNLYGVSQGGGGGQVSSCDGQRTGKRAMEEAKGLLKTRIESLKNSDYTSEFSEHEYSPIDLDRGAEANRQHEAVDPKFRALMEQAREAVKKLGRTLPILLL